MIKVNEIFYSIQGEGARVGTANVFIRLQGCDTKHACLASGVLCDTEFESGRDVGYADLLREIERYNCGNIIWTGGEPAQQLTPEIVGHFRKRGYYQSIETSGLYPAPPVDYFTVSPKVAEHVIARNFVHVDELRYTRHAGQSIPEPSITAENYFLSPHWGADYQENLRHCIYLVKTNIKWRLSVQMHKLLNIL